MANIREFESPVDSFRPDNLGPEALNLAANHQSSAAYRIQNFADRAGAKIGSGFAALGAGIQDYENENAGNAELGMAAPLAATTKELLQRKVSELYNGADPNDITVHDKALQVAADLIQQSGSGFKTDVGQKHWLGEQGDLYKYATSYIAGIDGQRAFDSTVKNFKTTLNSYAATLDNDPSELNLTFTLDALARNGTAAVASQRFLSADAGQKVLGLYTNEGRDVLVQHFLTGKAEKDPNFQADWDTGKYDKWKSSLSPDEQNNVQKMAAQAEKARVETLKQTQEMQTKAATAKVDQLSTKAISDNVTYDPNTGKLTVDPAFNQSILDIAKVTGPGPDGKPVPIAKPSELHTLFTLGQTIRTDSQKQTPATTDPGTYTDFRNRAFLPPDDPNRLTNTEVAQARIDHKLSDKDWASFHQALNVTSKDPQASANEKLFNGFFKSVKGFVSKSSPFQPANPQSEQRAYEMQQYLEDQFHAGLKMGRSPRALLTYGGPEGIMNDDVLKRYQLTLDDVLKTDNPSEAVTPLTNPNVLTGQQTTPALPPPKAAGVPWIPGESMDDYFKRMVGGGQ